MNYIILVNKENALDNKYYPTKLKKIKLKNQNVVYLNRIAYRNLLKLLKDINMEFKEEITIKTGYRPSLSQAFLFNDSGLKNDEIAKPFYSEHQTGLAVDLSIYVKTREIEKNDWLNYEEIINWLTNNAHNYGFIIRYPKNKSSITGYRYKPWHLRYVGKLATFLHQYDLTLEEYYDMFI